MNMKTLFAITGVVILIFGIGIGIGVHNLNKQAFSVDRYVVGFNDTVEYQYDATGSLVKTESGQHVKYSYDIENNLIQLSSQKRVIEAEISKRTITENESLSVTVFFSNWTSRAYSETISLLAPNFTVAPRDVQRTVAVPVGDKSASAMWILTPQKIGTYEIAITSPHYPGTVIFGIVVTNVFGFSPLQAQIFSYIGSALGAMLTIPWWLEQWGKKKKTSGQDSIKHESRTENEVNTTQPRVNHDPPVGGG